MACSNCGGAVSLEESDGGTRSGRFTERYECPHCGATGTVRGEASDPPGEWTRTGRVFRA